MGGDGGSIDIDFVEIEAVRCALVVQHIEPPASRLRYAAGVVERGGGNEGAAVLGQDLDGDEQREHGPVVSHATVWQQPGSPGNALHRQQGSGMPRT